MASSRMLTFKLSPSTRLFIQRADLTTFRGDAIVNAANERMLGGGGVDGAIHRAAGPDLLRACRAVAEVRPGVRCPTGECRLTGAGALPARHVIHTVGPVYDGPATSAPLLASAYRACLCTARDAGLASIAFPAISCGVYGYPLREAARIALNTCREEAGAVREVHFFLFSEPTLEAWTAGAKELGLEEEGG
ncbi:FAP376 [Auxenochlorella protothecoides x Auxenochlorella symbiontica]